MFKRLGWLPIACLLAAGFAGGCAGVKDLTRAEINLEQMKYEKAIEAYRSYLAQNPDSARAHSRLGYAYLQTGRLDEAVAELERSLSADPSDNFTLLYLGLAKVKKGEFGAAAALWRNYQNSEKPLMQQTVKQQRTLLLIWESHRQAEQALTGEKKLAAAAADPGSIAVCYYQDLSEQKNLRPFQKALAAMLITDLSKVSSLKVIERMRLQALLEELKLGQTGIVDPAQAPRVGRLLGAENLAVGSLGFDVQAVTSLASSSQEKIKGTNVCEVKRDNFFQLCPCIAQNIIQIMAVPLTEAEKAAIFGQPHTKNFQAFNYFGQGLDALDTGQWATAKSLFCKASMEDPQFDLAAYWCESCPDELAPGMAEIKRLSAPQLAAYVESNVNMALDKQVKLQRNAEFGDRNAEGGGGGGY